MRDPSLSALLAIEICAIFFVVPFAARGIPVARPVINTLLLAALSIVGGLSQRRGAVAVIVLGILGVAASNVLGSALTHYEAAVLAHGGRILVYSALTWVVGHSVYAPGRITAGRLQGAVVVYLNLAMVFAAAYTLVWQLTPDAFANIPASGNGDAAAAALLYFSLTTLTTTGYGDIVAVDPFARSLANLESVLGVFYLAIAVSRLVTLELQSRSR